MHKIILFTLPNCAPCKALKEQLNTEWISKKTIQIVFLDMNDGKEETLNEATKYGIRSAPSAVCIKQVLQIEGEEPVVDTQVCKTLEQIKEFFN